MEQQQQLRRLLRGVFFRTFFFGYFRSFPLLGDKPTLSPRFLQKRAFCFFSSLKSRSHHTAHTPHLATPHAPYPTFPAHLPSTISTGSIGGVGTPASPFPKHDRRRSNAVYLRSSTEYYPSLIVNYRIIPGMYGMICEKWEPYDIPRIPQVKLYKCATYVFHRNRRPSTSDTPASSTTTTPWHSC